MKLTNSEKMILVLLAEIHEKLGIQSKVNTNLIINSIQTNNAWALSLGIPGIVGGVPSPLPPKVSEVSNILDMWSFIENAYDAFDHTVKIQIEAEADPFGKYVQFRGFDGNNEAEYLSIARFLIRDLKRFPWFQTRELNSPCPTLAAYRRMLLVFEPIRKTLIDCSLSAAQVIEMLKA